jgi:acylphosphatase
MERIHVIVTGQVQGIGFRYFVKRQSEALCLTGFVRNLPEGQVEVVAEGSVDKLNQLIKLLEIGPSGALVIDLNMDMEAATGEFRDFQIVTHNNI